MQNLLDDLKEVLRNDERLVIDGVLNKAKIEELALNMDASILKLLSANNRLRKHFFQEVDGITVFDKIKFQKFVNNKSFLPDSYTAFKNKIGLASNGQYIAKSKEVVLAWPHKDCVLEGGQENEEEKRDEIFWNEILAPDDIDRLLSPKVFTRWKKYDETGEHNIDNLSNKDSYFVRGNNLLALHSLKEVFAEEVKLIYIDPPWNRDNDSFLYNDRFKHSTWLTFMNNRLQVAKDLLTKDGIIVVHCDFIEDSYLKVLMDEIFGRDKYVNTIAIRDSHPSGLKLSARDKTIIKTKSTMLVYKKRNDIRINPIYQRRYEWDSHFNTFVDIDSEHRTRIPLGEYIKNNRIVSDENFVLSDQALVNDEFRKFAFNNRHKIFQSTEEIPDEARERSLRNRDTVIEYSKGEFALNGRRLSPLSKSIYNIGFDGYHKEDFGKLLCDFWDDVDFNNSQNEGGVSFPQGKKPELLLARLISMFTMKDEIVCDFYSGAGTTAAVAHKMGRQYICVEQLDYGQNDSVTRLNNVIKGDQTGISKMLKWPGGGSFAYCELKKANQQSVDDINSAKSSEELHEIWQQIQEKAFISYKANLKAINENIDDFEELSLNEQKEFLIEVLDKNMLYVNYSEIDDQDFDVSEEDRKLNRLFYSLRK